MTNLNPPAIVGVVDNDDPWITAYLTLRHAVLTGQWETLDEIAVYATQLRRDLPDPAPPPSIAALIAADITITFPQLTDQLWTP